MIQLSRDLRLFISRQAKSVIVDQARACCSVRPYVAFGRTPCGSLTRRCELLNIRWNLSGGRPKKRFRPDSEAWTSTIPVLRLPQE